jgi:hypothetical protein
MTSVTISAANVAEFTVLALTVRRAVHRTPREWVLDGVGHLALGPIATVFLEDRGNERRRWCLRNGIGGKQAPRQGKL